MRHLFSCLSALAWCLILIPQGNAQIAGGNSGTLDELIDEVIPVLQLPGKKDTEDNFDEFRLGWALWETGEGKAGYSSGLEQLAHTSNSGETTLYSYFESLVSPLVETTTPLADIAGVMYPILYSAVYSEFDVSSGGDLDRALGTTGINLLSSQNTVFSPMREYDSMGGSTIVNFDYPSLTQIVGPAAALNGAKITQNVGFANNPIFGCGEFDYNFAHPVLTKIATIELQREEYGFGSLVPFFSFLTSRDLDDTNDDLGVLVDRTLWFKLSMLYPDVAQLLSESIVERIDAFPDSWIDYQTVSGEFFYSFNSIPDCSSGVNAGNYFNCLGEADYSENSFIHFRHWLEKKYQTIDELELKWGFASGGPDCQNIIDCDDVNPLEAEFYAANLQVVYDDWTAFQLEQYQVESYTYQYRAAKAARPHQAMYNHRGTPFGVDRAARYSDGVALGNWYGDNDGRLELPSDQKMHMLHALAWGESLNYPIFAMPRDHSVPYCWGGLVNFTWPNTYRPPCWDQDFSFRTLREFMTLGVDSVGLAYFENFSKFNIKDGTFGTTGVDQAEALGAEVVNYRETRAFTHPHRSPLIIHTGLNGVRPPEVSGTYNAGTPAGDLIRTLASQQMQFGLFSMTEGLDDLWLSSKREVLVSAFVRELDIELLNRYRQTAIDRGWDLLILTDAETKDSLSGDPTFHTCSEIELPGFFTSFDLGDLAGTCPPGPGLTHRLYALESLTRAVVELVTEFFVAPDIEVFADRSVTPFRATDAQGEELDNIDVNVATDGLNFLVSVANTHTSSQTVKLSVDISPTGPIAGYSIPGGDTFTLRSGEAQIRFVLADVPDLAQFVTNGDLDQAVIDAGTRVQARNQGGFDTRGAEALLLQLQGLSSSTHPEKIFAGLLRLERMPFVRFRPATDKVRVVDLDGVGISGASVQLEFVLQNRALRDAATPTDGFGFVTVSDLPPADSVWDFVAQEYIVPTSNIIEVHAQHPTFGSQGIFLSVPTATPPGG